MLADFFISVSFYLVPLFLGLLFTRGLILGYSIGVLSTFLIILIFNYFNLNYLLKPIFFLIFLTSLLKIVKNPNKNLTLNKNHIFVILLLFFSTLVFLVIWKKNTPYPLSINWDIYEHISVANNISNGFFGVLPSQISDTFTFDGYTSIFHSLLSLPKILFERELLGIYWWLEYWHYLSVTYVGFLLCKTLFNKTSAAILGGFLSALVFESSIVYSNLFLIPQTFSALIFAFLINNYLKSYNQPNSKYQPFKLNDLLASIFLIISFHFVIGLAATFIVILLYFLRKFDLKIVKYAVFVSVVVFLLSAFLNTFGSVPLTSREEARYFDLNLFKKLQLFLDWYGIYILLFLPIGIFYILKSNKKPLFEILVITLFSASIAIAPFSYSYKFFVLTRYLLNIIIVGGLIYTFGYLKLSIQKILYFISIVFLFFVFYFNQLSYKDQLQFLDYKTHFSFEEKNASEFLLKTYPLKTLLISDPGTQYIFEALTGLNSQGGAYMDYLTRKKLIEIYLKSDPEEIIKIIKEIDDLDPKYQKPQKRILILSGRFFAWEKLPQYQKESFYYNIWSPTIINSEDKKFVELMLKSSKTKLILENDQMTIIEIL